MPRERDTSYIDEDYLIREWWLELAKKLAPLFHQLGGKYNDLNGNHADNINHDLTGEVNWNWDRKAWKRSSISLTNIRYDKGLAAKEYGDVIIVSNKPVDSGRGYIFDRTGFDKDTVIDHEFGYVLRESKRKSLNQEYRASIRNKTTSTVSASADVGPVSAEASVVNETEVSFESAVGLEEEKEYSNEFKDTITEHVPVDAGTKVRGVVQATRVITETPYKVKGYLDADITVDMYNYAGEFREGHMMFPRGKHQNRRTFQGVQGLLKALNGYDLSLLGMKDFHRAADKASVDAWNWLEEKENRMVDATGVKREETDRDALVKLYNLR